MLGKVVNTQLKTETCVRKPVDLYSIMLGKVVNTQLKTETCVRKPVASDCICLTMNRSV